MKKIDVSKIVNIIVILILIVLTFARIELWLKTPILIYSDEVNDDKLLYDYAKTISEGRWLGDYHQLTLVKGISFSVFEVICNKLAIPYTLGMAILNIASSLLLCFALRKKVNTKYLYFTYLVLLYSPIGFTSLVSQRNYRNAIIPTTVILIFAGYIGLFLRKDQSIRKLLVWSLITSLSMVFFWFVKEDSIWILPFVLTISVLMVLYWIINDRKKMVFKIVILLIPFICVGITDKIISSLNNKYYGISVVSDKADAEFGRMISNLFKIEDTERTAGKNIWITNNMLQKAFSVSPTFADLKANMDTNPSWTYNGEVEGDLIIWKIRYIMSIQNYYENAPKANEFCRNVNKELEIAFNNGTLLKDNKLHIASQVRGLSIMDLINFIPPSFKWLNDFSKYDNCGVTQFYSVGKPEEIKEIRNFLHLPEKNIDEKNFKNVQEKSNTVVELYTKLAVITNVLAILGFASFTIKTIYEILKKKFSSLDIWLVTTGVILSLIVLCLELNIFFEFFTEEKLQRYRTFYAAGTFPLIEISKCLSIYLLLTLLIDLINKIKEKINLIKTQTKIISEN